MMPWMILLAAVGTGSIFVPQDVKRDPYFRPTRPLVSVSHQGSEFIGDFNRAGPTRVLVPLLSPTQDGSLDLARAIQARLEENRGDRTRLLAVWVALLPSDSRSSALAATGDLADSRVTHYWDPWRFVLRAFSTRLSQPSSSESLGVMADFDAAWGDLAPRPQVRIAVGDDRFEERLKALVPSGTSNQP